MSFIGSNITPLFNTVIGSNSTGGTGLVNILRGQTVATTPEESTTGETGQGTTTGQNTTTDPTTQQPPIVQGERETVLERIRQSADLDPAAKIRILKLAQTRTELTAQNLRVIFATCLYPTAQGLPAPEGYEYFLTKLESGQTVEAALSDARLYFKADQNQKSPSDPDTPDSQETANTQGKIIIAAGVAFVLLILFNR